MFLLTCMPPQLLAIRQHPCWQISGPRTAQAPGGPSPCCRLTASKLKACLPKSKKKKEPPQKNSATHFKCFLPFIFIIACHAMFFDSLLIYYLFHFFHFPFFACCSSCFFPSSKPLFPCVDTTATTEPAVHGWYCAPVLSSLSAVLSGKASLGRSGGGWQRGEEDAPPPHSGEIMFQTRPASHLGRRS